MWTMHGIEPREGAELRKRVSVCQRSAQGAKAPQRPPAKQAEPLTAHPKIVETVNSGWSLFCCRCTGSNPYLAIYKNAWRTKPAFYRWETNN